MVITRTSFPIMGCEHCEVKKANIFDCLIIHNGVIPDQCIANTWGDDQ